MAKRPDTQETVLLALELLRRIPRSREITAAELHQQLSGAGLCRDIRTVQRQLEMLSGCEHFDIERDDSRKPYRYRWKERAKGLSLPIMSAQESLLFSLAEQHLRDLLPANLLKSMDGFFIQAKANLDGHVNSQLEKEWLSKVRVISTTQPLLPPNINPGVFDAVSNALYTNCWLNLEYKNAKGELANRDVMPLGLAQQGSRLYLVCRFRSYENERSLALHRIVSAEASTLRFDRPNFDFEKYDADGRFGFGEGSRVRLSFRIAKEAGFHLLESPLSIDQEVMEADDHYEISATVVDTAQLEWWLRGFGEAVSQVRRISIDLNQKLDCEDKVATQFVT